MGDMTLETRWTKNTFSWGVAAHFRSLRPLEKWYVTYIGSKITKDKNILNYCGGGIAASLEAFVLYQLGFEKIVIYDNSLHEWAAIDQTLPMENN